MYPSGSSSCPPSPTNFTFGDDVRRAKRSLPDVEEEITEVDEEMGDFSSVADDEADTASNYSCKFAVTRLATSRVVQKPLY
jgi:hypothetical protein